MHGDLLAPIPATVCLIVANLPYLPDSLQDDPRTPSTGRSLRRRLLPEHGLAHYRRLLDAAEERLDVDGALVIQFHRRVLTAARSELEALRKRLGGRATPDRKVARASRPCTRLFTCSRAPAKGRSAASA